MFELQGRVGSIDQQREGVTGIVAHVGIVELERIERSLTQVGLSSRHKHLPSQLSGGQQQRVAIARALAGDPLFLLADEPTGNLDSEMASQVMALLQEINDNGTTIIMVTHDPSLAGQASRNITLLDGRVDAGQVTKLAANG